MLLQDNIHGQTQNTNDLALKYLVKEPSIKSAKLPVLILLHGIGSNEQDLFSMANQLPNQMLIISARAPYTLSQGSYAWYHMDLSSGKPVYSSEEAEKSRNLILQFIDQIKTKYKTRNIFQDMWYEVMIMIY